MDYLKTGSQRRHCMACYDRLKLGICTLNSISQHNIIGYIEIPYVFFTLIDCICMFNVIVKINRYFSSKQH